MNCRRYRSDCLEARRSRSLGVTARAMCALGMSCLFLLLPASPLMSQETKLVQRAASTDNSPFAELNDALAQTADGLLASAGQARPENADAPPVDTHATNLDPLSEVGLHRSQATGALSRLRAIRPFIDPVLQKIGIPTELAAVVLIESGGDPRALSPKGARGLWQLMPDTARRYGLEVNNDRDERLDILKSTQAAANYLHDLYAQFHDWRLVLAAYNTGEQNVERAIAKGRTENFVALSSMNLLPAETRNYVPAVLEVMPRFGRQLALDTPVSTPQPITAFALAGE